MTGGPGRVRAGAVALVALLAAYLAGEARPAGDGGELERLDSEVVRLHQEGKFSDAIPLAGELLERREKALGPGHPDVARSLNNLALLYRATGDYARAASLYERSLAIWEKALGPEHPDVATALNNLAALYQHTGEGSRLKDSSSRGLQILSKDPRMPRGDAQQRDDRGDVTDTNDVAPLRAQEPDGAGRSAPESRSVPLRSFRFFGPSLPVLPSRPFLLDSGLTDSPAGCTVRVR